MIWQFIQEQESIALYVRGWNYDLSYQLMNVINLHQLTILHSYLTAILCYDKDF